MSDSQVTVTAAIFAQKLKEKYPQYASVPDDRLIGAFTQRKPQYRVTYDGTTPVSISWEGATSVSAPNADQTAAASTATTATPNTAPAPKGEFAAAQIGKLPSRTKLSKERKTSTASRRASDDKLFVERRNFERVSLPAIAFALDLDGNEMGHVAEVSGGGLLLDPASAWARVALVKGQQLVVTIVEPASGNQTVMKVEVRHVNSNTIGLRFLATVEADELGPEVQGLR